MRTTRPKEIEGVLRLDGAARFAHFMKRVADEQLAWGLRADGWALMVDDEGQSAFPIWPAREYAALCAVDDWAGYHPTLIPVDELMSEWASRLKGRAVRPAVFPTPTGKGVVVSVDEFCEALRSELSQYE